MAEELNRFFSSVFTQEDLQQIPEAKAENIERRMEEIKITAMEVRRRIKKLRKDAAAGPDGISPKLLQQFENSLALPLAILFNKSIEAGEVPQDWREATVTPIFKKGTVPLVSLCSTCQREKV